MKRPDYDYPAKPPPLPPPLQSVPPDQRPDRLRPVLWFACGALATLGTLALAGVLP